MYIFSDTKKEDENFENFIRNSIYRNVDILLKGKIKNVNDFLYNNVIICDNYEINIQYKRLNYYKFHIYELNYEKNLRIIFGCELETCILAKCSNVNYLEKLIKENDIKYWGELIKSYVEKTIFPFIDGEFISKFPYGYIKYYPKSYDYDYIIDFKQKSVTKVNNTLSEKDNKKNILDLISYKYIIFTRDSSLICGDTLYKNVNDMEIITKSKLDEKTFHCEIITPILSDINDLKILYDYLFKHSCFKGNESAAFHVNVSMLNSKNEIIYFSKGFIDCFLDLYEKYENKKYDKYRPIESWYAKKILNYAKEYTYKYSKPLINLKNKKSFEYFYDNFLEGKKFYRSFIEFEGNIFNKYNSIHMKNNHIMEFRLFPTEDNYNPLINYVMDSINILLKSSNEYYKNYNKIVRKLQRLNLENKISFYPIKYYEGYLYYYNQKIVKFLNCKTFEEIFHSLDIIFNLHNQTIVKYIKNNIDLYTFTIIDNLSNKLEYFELKILEDGYIILKKISS